MLRYADRITAIGAIVITLAVLILSLMLKQEKPRAVDQAWTARDRGAVATGSVREEPSDDQDAALYDPLDKPLDKPETPVIAEQQREPEPIAKPAIRSEEKRAVVAKERVKKNARAHETKTVNRGNTKTVAAVEKAPIAPIVQQKEPPMAVEAPRAEPIIAVEPPPPAPPVVAIAPTHAPAPPVTNVASTSGPKTRAEVQNELKKARMNGDLPKFGNPDPYGPGGAPSASSQ